MYLASGRLKHGSKAMMRSAVVGIADWKGGSRNVVVGGGRDRCISGRDVLVFCRSEILA
jgi:hypothetical protein